MTELDFTPWPKTFRMNRDVIVTEKIDGTNAAVRVVDAAVIPDLPSALDEGDRFEGHVLTLVDGRGYLVGAQSRKKNIWPEADNAGFARWVFENATDLARVLGPGTHFGEWYGQAIQSNKYGLDGKRFMLFNVIRWGATETREMLKGTLGIEVATVLYHGPFDTYRINKIVDSLDLNGSQHVPGVNYAEGVIVHHTQAGFNLKVTTEKDEQPKGIAHA